jgi:hypothetical protein
VLNQWMTRACVVALLLAVCLTVTGCGGSKVTKENAEKIKKGMTEKEVNDVLGAPKTSVDKELMGVKIKMATWEDGDKKIMVNYDKDNKVDTVVKQGL